MSSSINEQKGMAYHMQRIWLVEFLFSMKNAQFTCTLRLKKVQSKEMHDRW